MRGPDESQSHSQHPGVDFHFQKETARRVFENFAELDRTVRLAKKPCETTNPLKRLGLSESDAANWMPHRQTYNWAVPFWKNKWHCMHACVYIFIFTCMPCDVCMHVCMRCSYESIHVYMNACHAYIYVCMRCMNTCMCIYLYV